MYWIEELRDICVHYINETYDACSWGEVAPSPKEVLALLNVFMAADKVSGGYCVYRFQSGQICPTNTCGVCDLSRAINTAHDIAQEELTKQ